MNAQIVLGVLALIISVNTEAPYPPRGFRPQGQQFNLPNRAQQNVRYQNQYEAPPNQNYNSNGNQYEASRIQEARRNQNQNAYNTIDGRFRQDEQNYVNHENQNAYNTIDGRFRQDEQNNQNYVSAPRDELRQRGYPEPTTKKPKIEKEPRNEDPVEPNIAISTAVANGQIYYLNPNGLLQRVYKATENGEESENQVENVYQSTNPALGTIFAYSAPLVTIN